MKKIYAYCSIQYPFCEININNYKNTLLLFTVRAYLFLLYSCFLILKLVSFLVNQQFKSSKSLILSYLFIQRLHCRDFNSKNYIFLHKYSKPLRRAGFRCFVFTKVFVNLHKFCSKWLKLWLKFGLTRITLQARNNPASARFLLF